MSHNGNPNSLEAWEHHRTRNTNACEAVLKAIEAAGPHGMTSKEAAAALGWPINAVSGRFSDLEKKHGKIRGTGQRRMGAEVHEVVRVPEQVSLWEAA